MPARKVFVILLTVSTVSLILLILNRQSYSNVGSAVDIKQPTKKVPIFTPNLQKILEPEYWTIKANLSNYQFPSNTGLQDFTPITDGQPIRSILVASWRTGSTFLGDIMQATSGNFYHYEPLEIFGIRQIRGPPDADAALDVLRKLLRCEYKDLKEYLTFAKTHGYVLSHNSHLWAMFKKYPKQAFNATFVSEYCSLFPFQIMKLVRLRLSFAEELLKDETLNVRVLLLVRDPRGTLQSRKHREWCPGAPDCDQANLLCADMVSDYSAAIKLQKLYPSRFRAIRYEDLSVDPYEHVQDLFKFFGLYFHPEVKAFLDSHTKSNAGGVSSTFRNSKSAPFHWRSDLNFSEVQYIEENCDQAMKLWGYVKAYNESHLREFNPVTLYTIDDSKT